MSVRETLERVRDDGEHGRHVDTEQVSQINRLELHGVLRPMRGLVREQVAGIEIRHAIEKLVIDRDGPQGSIVGNVAGGDEAFNRPVCRTHDHESVRAPPSAEETAVRMSVGGFGHPQIDVGRNDAGRYLVAVDRVEPLEALGKKRLQLVGLCRIALARETRLALRRAPIGIVDRPSPHVERRGFQKPQLVQALGKLGDRIGCNLKAVLQLDARGDLHGGPLPIEELKQEARRGYQRHRLFHVPGWIPQDESLAVIGIDAERLDCAEFRAFVRARVRARHVRVPGHDVFLSHAWSSTTSPSDRT